MPKKLPEPSDLKPQRERFAEAAKDVGADETGAEFERLFAKVVPAKDKPKKR